MLTSEPNYYFPKSNLFSWVQDLSVPVSQDDTLCEKYEFKYKYVYPESGYYVKDSLYTVVGQAGLCTANIILSILFTINNVTTC